MTETITEKIDRITHIPESHRKILPPAPRSVKIELTGRCNYRCGFCALRLRNTQPRKRDDMELGFFKRITAEMMEAGVEEIGLFYLGEPLVAPELAIDACRYLKKELGMPYVFMTTNGSLATREVLHGLMDAGLDSLKFSINACDDEQFEDIMGVKATLYHRALAAIRRARELRDEHPQFTTRLYASSIMYDGEQAERMAAIVEKYIDPWVDEHYYLPLYSMGSVATEKEEELGYRPTAGNMGRIGGLVPPLPCWSLFSEGHVRHDGILSLCCFDADGRFQVGNLHDASFMEVWHSDKFSEVRAAHLRGDVTGTVCEDCVAYG